jgi:chromosome segregation ATPase
LPPRADDALLPTLLALRAAHGCIHELHASTARLRARLAATAGEDVAAEQAHLRDSKAVAAALQRRLAALEQQQAQRSRTRPEALAQEQKRALDDRRRKYRDGLVALMDALNRFTDAHLAAMLAAEAEGGPVVGLAPATDSQPAVS